MHTRRIPCRYGAFHVTAVPERRSILSELTSLHVFVGEYEYERKRAEYVETMVDVGCNVGAAMAWAADWWPNLKRVIGYDPNAEALEFARVNMVNCWPSMVTELHHLAVSVEQHPIFKEHEDWGGSRTHGETSGVRVPGIHPRDLPGCDVFKVDAEGVDADVFDHYAHWPGVRVTLFEYHAPPDQKRMVAVCEREGLVMVKHDVCGPDQGVMVWVRP